jgi:outer membrane protein OmpU
MKNILFATTALVATAGIASADVSITGFAEIGVFDTGSGDMQLFNDIDVTFSMTGETEGGMSFGASVDLDEISDVAVNQATDNNSRAGIAANISGGFGTVTLGDTDGASDWALTETAVGGSMADDHTGHAGYSGNSPFDGVSDGQILSWTNTVGAMGVAISFEQAADGATSDNDDTVQIGLKYSMEAAGATIGLGIGYADAGSQTAVTTAGSAETITVTTAGDSSNAGLDDAVLVATAAVADTETTGDTNGMGISLSVASGNLTGVLNYSDGEVLGVDASHVALGIGVTMDALTIGVNWGEFDTDNVKTNGVGLAVNYNLGGGAVFQLGYGDGEGVDTMSMGLALSF